MEITQTSKTMFVYHGNSGKLWNFSKFEICAKFCGIPWIPQIFAILWDHGKPGTLKTACLWLGWQMQVVQSNRWKHTVVGARHTRLYTKSPLSSFCCAHWCSSQQNAYSEMTFPTNITQHHLLRHSVQERQQVTKCNPTEEQSLYCSILTFSHVLYDPPPFPYVCLKLKEDIMTSSECRVSVHYDCFRCLECVPLGLHSAWHKCSWCAFIPTMPVLWSEEAPVIFFDEDGTPEAMKNHTVMTRAQIDMH